MSTSRRNFLKKSSIGLVCAGIPASLASTTMGSVLNPINGPTERREFSKALFTPYLNTTFRIHAGLAPVDLKLKTITDHKANGKRSHRGPYSESFSLLFASESEAINLSQETFVVEHPELGRFPL